MAVARGWADVFTILQWQSGTMCKVELYADKASS